ncbi:hypothetical protein [Polyangium sp. y55x31]|uniref:hypothetical protein n=1 Tax=Polyangium sp. y55x31 TaxID=3042688 RepID=UPI002482FA40|nr:hypothetical protein [Polyangium sp. y55x31]MDI1483148.1 hypothetical protein [Polyangium sp. y55x31]
MPPSSTSSIPTLLTGADNDRGALIGALAFVEGVGIGAMGARELKTWIEEYLVRAGRMQRPVQVAEPMAGTLLLDTLNTVGAPPSATKALLDRILGRARSRVVFTLRGLITDPPEDGFLEIATKSSRVQPLGIGSKVSWIARPQKEDSLSDIVLSLFAADILSNRNLYDQNLCVCDTCGRVSFRAKMMSRTGCREHNDGPPGVKPTSSRST